MNVICGFACGKSALTHSKPTSSIGSSAVTALHRKSYINLDLRQHRKWSILVNGKINPSAMISMSLALLNVKQKCAGRICLIYIMNSLELHRLINDTRIYCSAKLCCRRTDMQNPFQRTATSFIASKIRTSHCIQHIILKDNCVTLAWICSYWFVPAMSCGVRNPPLPSRTASDVAIITLHRS